MVAIERFFKYLEIKELKHTPIEKNLGFSNGYLGKMKAKKASIGSDMLEKIICMFPDINSEWLLTGRGPMLKSDTYKNSVSSASCPSPVENNISHDCIYRELLEKKDAENKALNREIGKLQAQLEASRKEVVSLDLVNSSLREELELAKKMPERGAKGEGTKGKGAKGEG